MVFPGFWIVVLVNFFFRTFLGGRKRMWASWWMSQGTRWSEGNSAIQHYVVPSGWNFGCAEKLGGFPLIDLILGICFVNQSSLVKLRSLFLQGSARLLRGWNPSADTLSFSNQVWPKKQVKAFSLKKIPVKILACCWYPFSLTYEFS